MTAGVLTWSVKVTHEPTGISVCCTSQHFRRENDALKAATKQEEQ
jgi:protein subunit release factor B